MSLYRKYRPQTFDEVVGQDHVTRTLTNALAKQQVAHAYLFAGPRGTAKTTAARILARELGCGELDIIEIDAASHRGIDEVRALREQVQFRPTSGEKKIYILDEVHMLTKEAFNALLKILEEPPQFAHFVLCTTEPHKVPVTIISRTQRFDFRPGSVEDLSAVVKRVADSEGVELSDEVVRIIATHASGGYRDALSILEQIIHSSHDDISEERVLSVIGIADKAAVQALLNAILDKNTSEALTQIVRMEEQRVQWPYVLSLMLQELRYMLRERVDSKAGETAELVALIRLLVQSSRDVRNAPVASLPLEMAVIEWGRDEGESKEQKANSKESTPNSQRLITNDQKQTTNSQPQTANDQQPTANSQEPIASLWPEILRVIKPYNHTLEALLKGCQPGLLQENVLTLHFRYKFHKEKIEDMTNRRIVEEVIQKVTGAPVSISCVLVADGAGAQQARFRDDESVIDIEEPPVQKSSRQKSSRPGTMRSAKGNDTIALAMKELSGKVIEEKKGE